MDTAAYIQRGNEKFDKEDFEGAIDDFKKAIEFEPNNYIAYYQWGKAQFCKYKIWELIELMLSDGNNGIGNEQYHKVIDITTEVIKTNPHDVNALLYRGKAKQQIHNYSEAIEDLSKVIEIDPLNIEAYYDNASAKELSKDFSGAIEDYSHIIEIDANSDKAYEKRAYIKFNDNDISGAIEDCSKVIEINPKNFYAYRCRGNAKAKMRLYQEAIDEYTVAIEIGNKSYDYHIRAQVKEKIEDFDGAIQDYLKAIEIDNDYCSYCELGRIHYNRKEYEQALEYVNKAIELSPSPTEMYELKGKIMGEIDLKTTDKNMTSPLNYGLSKTGLPLIIVKIFDHDTSYFVQSTSICLMLDTGSNRNIIDHRIYNHFKDRLKPSESSSEVFTLNGAATGITIDVPFNFENYDYHEPFLCTEQTDAFDRINEESGIQIHGILGNHFFLKHGWVLDFEQIKVYT